MSDIKSDPIVVLQSITRKHLYVSLNDSVAVSDAFAQLRANEAELVRLRAERSGAVETTVTPDMIDTYDRTRERLWASGVPNEDMKRVALLAAIQASGLPARVKELEAYNDRHAKFFTDPEYKKIETERDNLVPLAKLGLVVSERSFWQGKAIEFGILNEEGNDTETTIAARKILKENK